MLRANVLLPFLGELQRFDIASHPATSPKGLLAARGGLTRLPRWFYGVPELDSLCDDLLGKSQADDDFSGHTTLC